MNREIKFVMIYRNMMQYDVVVESKTDNNIKTQRICEFVLKGKKDNKEVHIEILDKQYRAPKNLQDSMYEAGQVLYEPIFLNRINNQVTYNVDGEKSVPFSSFIEEYVFGEKYKYIFDDADIDDMWYFFLQGNPI